MCQRGTCFSALKEIKITSSYAGICVWSDESHALIASSPYAAPMKKERICAGVKTEQVTAEGLVDFAQEGFAHWNY